MNCRLLSRASRLPSVLEKTWIDSIAFWSRMALHFPGVLWMRSLPPRDLFLTFQNVAGRRHDQVTVNWSFHLAQAPTSSATALTRGVTQS